MKDIIRKPTILEQLRKAFPLFSWTKSSGSYHGVITVPAINRIIDKDRHTFSDVRVFISFQMNPSNSEPFVYLTVHQYDTITRFRCRNSYTNESGKLYASAPDHEQIISKLKKEIDMSKYILS